MHSRHSCGILNYGDRGVDPTRGGPGGKVGVSAPVFCDACERDKVRIMRAGFASTSHFRTIAQFEPGPPLVEHPFEGLPEDPFGEEATAEAREEGAAAEHNLPEDPFGEPTNVGDGGSSSPHSLVPLHEAHIT